MTTESQLQFRIRGLAKLRHWHLAHFRPAMTQDGWRTPVEGDAGFPDLVLARNGRLIIAELKSDTGKPTPAQTNWLDELGEYGRLWRPGDWNDIQEELR